MLATAKHFAGDGLTTYGTGSNMHTTGNYPIDQGVDQVDHATFARLALSPYVTAVRVHHVGAVMPSYSDVDWTEDGLGNRINMHGNRDLITGSPAHHALACRAASSPPRSRSARGDTVIGDWGYRLGDSVLGPR